MGFKQVLRVALALPGCVSITGYLEAHGPQQLVFYSVSVVSLVKSSDLLPILGPRGSRFLKSALWG